MKVVTRLMGAFCLLVAVLAGLLVYHVRTNRAAVSASYELAAISSRLSLTNSRQIAAINQLEEAAGKYRVTGDDGYLRLFEQAFGDFGAGLAGIVADARTQQEQVEIDALHGEWERFTGTAAALGTPGLLSADAGPALVETLASLRQQTRRVMDASQAAMGDRLAASAAASVRAERVSLIVGAATLVLTVFVFSFLVRSISGGLNRLQRGTQQIAAGNFDYRIPADGGDEFAQLASDFNTMTRRLGELDRMKRDFISKVSHDLKTPLASMRETVQLLLDGVPGPITDRQRRLLELTNQSAVRLSSMIVRILDLSAIEAGAVALEKGTHSAGDLATAAVAALAPDDGIRGTRIALDLPTEPVFVDCDRDRALQVLVNLLENAAKFSPVESTVRLRVRKVARELTRASVGDPGPRGTADGSVLFEVIDRGRGVPLSERRHIFEHFYQSSAKRPAPATGVGLGLAICREIVELHGGAIWVEDNPGGGSIFSVLLPGARSAPHHAGDRDLLTVGTA